MDQLNNFKFAQLINGRARILTPSGTKMRMDAYNPNLIYRKLENSLLNSQNC